MIISESPAYPHRFNIKHIEDPGFKKNGKLINGIYGYHGLLENIIGFILEKIFHKTVAVKTVDGSGTYYLNCISLVKWLKRVKPGIDPSQIESKSHDSKWVAMIINELLKAKKQPNTELSSEKTKEQSEKEEAEPEEKTKNKLSEIRERAEQRINERREQRERIEQQRTEQKEKQALLLRLKNAIQNENLDLCKRLIEQGAEADPQYEVVLTPLEEAIYHPGKDLRMLKFLVEEKGLNVNKRGDMRRLPIEVAIILNKLEVVQYLFEHGADIRLESSEKGSLAEYAQNNIRDYEVNDDMYRYAYTDWNQRKQAILQLLTIS